MTQALHEAIDDFRGGAVLGVIAAVNDAGQAQTVDVHTHDGILRTAIEVMQIFGVASMPPIAGGIALLIAVGGDPGHYVALPLSNPSTRFGNLAAGDGGVIYAQDGSRVAVRAGGVVEVLGFSEVVIQAPNVAITASGDLAIAGPVTIAGNLSVTGTVSVTGDMSVTGTITAAHVITTG